MFPATPWISATLSRNKFMMRLPPNCPTIRNQPPEHGSETHTARAGFVGRGFTRAV
jgi:hypothetical protein